MWLGIGLGGTREAAIAGALVGAMFSALADAQAKREVN